MRLLVSFGHEDGTLSMNSSYTICHLFPFADIAYSSLSIDPDHPVCNGWWASIGAACRLFGCSVKPCADVLGNIWTLLSFGTLDEIMLFFYSHFVVCLCCIRWLTCLFRCSIFFGGWKTCIAMLSLSSVSNANYHDRWFLCKFLSAFFAACLQSCVSNPSHEHSIIPKLSYNRYMRSSPHYIGLLIGLSVDEQCAEDPVALPCFL